MNLFISSIGEDKGIHAFVVQLRSLETGEALPGIDIGDCGKKLVITNNLKEKKQLRMY